MALTYFFIHYSLWKLFTLLIFFSVSSYFYVFPLDLRPNIAFFTLRSFIILTFIFSLYSLPQLMHTSHSFLFPSNLPSSVPAPLPLVHPRSTSSHYTLTPLPSIIPRQSLTLGSSSPPAPPSHSRFALILLPRRAKGKRSEMCRERWLRRYDCVRELLQYCLSRKSIREYYSSYF